MSAFWGRARTPRHAGCRGDALRESATHTEPAGGDRVRDLTCLLLETNEAGVRARVCACVPAIDAAAERWEHFGSGMPPNLVWGGPLPPGCLGSLSHSRPCLDGGERSQGKEVIRGEEKTLQVERSDPH